MNLNASELNLDAWSDGQIQSKLWLCRELEKIWSIAHSNMWIYGSWYGTLAQILLYRERLSINQFQFFEIEPQSLEISKKLSLTWQIHKIAKFIFNLQDCLTISTEQILKNKPDLIINTSCEHFESYSWFYKLPPGQKFVIQTTNMSHPTHILKTNSLAEFLNQIGPVSQIDFAGEYLFDYPINPFIRFMIIGTK